MRVLICDDEENIRNLMQRFLRMEGLDSDTAENGISAKRLLRENPYDAVLMDLRMPGMSGLEVISWMRGEGFRIPVIMISAHGDVSDAVAALKQGAQDYIVKPFDPEEVVIRIKSLVEAEGLRRIAENERPDESGLIGESPEMIAVKRIISRIATSSATVLITGESGTGKEVVAREIHRQSRMASDPFVAINIGGVPENLLESELFGYEKGAFTGAVQRKTGLFELAAGGTLFLDEIGDMPISLQVKILRVLQERRITRLGGTEPIPINARIIAATNKNLEKLVVEGTFREDLFYRLNVVRIQLPPLRDRKSDIPILAAYIVSQYSKKMGGRVTGFTPEALDALKNHSFYGNVRELENIIERAIIFADSDTIDVTDLDLRTSGVHSVSSSEGNGPASFTLRDAEKNAIVQSLQRWEGNRTKAAKELGISRRTLISKIQEYGIEL